MAINFTQSERKQKAMNVLENQYSASTARSYNMTDSMRNMMNMILKSCILLCTKSAYFTDNGKAHTFENVRQYGSIGTCRSATL